MNHKNSLLFQRIMININTQHYLILTGVPHYVCLPVLQYNTDFSLIYYSQTLFDAPAGNDPVALNLGSMGKGEAWVNGQSIGRYWVSFHTSQGSPSQTW